MMMNRVQKAYDELSYDYEHRVDKHALYNIDYERPAMMNLLPQDLKGKMILDAGCAAGWYTEQFIKLGAGVTAIDLSSEMVAATKRRVGDQAEVLCLDLADKLPFKDNTFDFIVSSLVLHYVKDWGPTFQEFKRILKPDGILLFSVHHPFMDINMSQNQDYFSTEFIVDQWKRQGKFIEVTFYRRPLHLILNETLAHFSLEKLIEPQPTKEFEKKNPETYEKLMKNPHFMIIKARVLGTGLE
ncbi:class I SAM-dependent methyltransferase [Bacillus sp. APMAM]|nr:class I SAM-dependent methyltransferase [Heyndrickxia shackletonii]MBB2482605.1 class I SAM-dependent methyltransferase [Bacillus sp. APMAM]NEZ00174.1 class I SAM-dependent methyltransferase [Heyndrickxia shackletonii]RTZ53984.1 class I SAM-dependent methyltransferase [Bacillus sp. SAJ1]